MEYQQTLIKAVTDAMNVAAQQQDDMEIDAIDHLMAQKRDDGTWCVRMSDSFDADFLTHLSDNIQDCAGSTEDVAARIEDMWDEEWTEVQVDRPAGDFSYGSSDWRGRNLDAE